MRLLHVFVGAVSEEDRAIALLKRAMRQRGFRVNTSPTHPSSLRTSYSTPEHEDHASEKNTQEHRQLYQNLDLRKHTTYAAANTATMMEPQTHLTKQRKSQPLQTASSPLKEDNHQTETNFSDSKTITNYSSSKQNHRNLLHNMQHDKKGGNNSSRQHSSDHNRDDKQNIKQEQQEFDSMKSAENFQGKSGNVTVSRLTAAALAEKQRLEGEYSSIGRLAKSQLQSHKKRKKGTSPGKSKHIEDIDNIECRHSESLVDHHSNIHRQNNIPTQQCENIVHSETNGNVSSFGNKVDTAMYEYEESTQVFFSHSLCFYKDIAQKKLHSRRDALSLHCFKRCRTFFERK